MQFNGHTNNEDLYSDTRDWCGIEETDTTTYPLTKFTRAANKGLDKAITLIFKSDARWKWDDANNTSDLPIAYSDLEADQSDYGIAVTHLKIRRMRVTDTEGNWITIERKTRRELTDAQLNAESSTPTSYDIVGNSLIFNPAPSYSTDGAATNASGIEMQLQRGASYFDIADTTKKPGFASQFHQLVSLYAAEEYCAKNDMPKRLAVIQNAIIKMEGDVQLFYSQRDEDEQPKLSVRNEDYGISSLL
jgi:hypothetical protein